MTSVSGKVRMSRIGRSTAFTKPNTSAEMSKEDLLENLMPLNKALATHNERLIIAQWIRKSVIFWLSSFCFHGLNFTV